MTVPPYIVGCFFCISLGYAADRLKTRGLFMMGCNVAAIIGLAMLLGSKSYNVRYAGTFFFCSGVYANVPQGVSDLEAIFVHALRPTNHYRRSPGTVTTSGAPPSAV